MKINGKTLCLWRAVDHEGESLEAHITKKRDKASALKSQKKAMKRYGRSHEVVIDRSPSYGAAMREIGNCYRRVTGRPKNNRAENSHVPFRRGDRAMTWIWRMRSLQKFAAAHCSVHNHFNLNRQLNQRDGFKNQRDAARLEWRELLAS